MKKGLRLRVANQFDSDRYLCAEQSSNWVTGMNGAMESEKSKCRQTSNSVRNSSNRRNENAKQADKI